MNWIIDANPCPGLFYGTRAQDGFLLRIRTPGGQLNLSQGRAIAQWLKEWDCESLQVTNRGNLQLRSLAIAPSPQVFAQLQHLGLGARLPQLDHLRNIMASPTAGIDSQELLDTRPWVQALDDYIQTSPHLAALPAKFSIGIDGGGSVAIGTRSEFSWDYRYNEIQLSVVALDDGNSGRSLYFYLALAAGKQLHDSGCVIPIQQGVNAVAALTQAYLDYLSQAAPLPQPGRKPRLKHLLADWGMEGYLQQVRRYLSQPLPEAPPLTLQPCAGGAHLGVQPQRQPGLVYIGVDLPLGRLTPAQFQGVLDLVEQFGEGVLRLTPWQSLIMANIAEDQVERVLERLQGLGLSGEDPEVAIAACTGKPGCSAAASATQVEAMRLLEELPQQLGLGRPVNIHLTACPKSCAQPGPAEMTLLGISLDCYHLYLGDGVDSWKHDLGPVAVEDLSRVIGGLLRSYKRERHHRDESLSDWGRRLDKVGVQECLR
ncbi:precorrin-3B synthase [Sodalinema gerasimenkoae]|uniref:precorrin-3B synthase n=1 Tax=Sodalinema gerasimenkoae TaxID=2862348 RepID=UPI00135B88D3|nr:precorrin-3B synthase [Sodalinema gerasimenkoae]